jgi:chitinase
VRLRALSSILAVAALVAAGVTFSGAAFTAAGANPGNNFSTAAVFESVTLTDPGTPLHGTVTLDASTTGTIVSVTIQRSAAGAGTWTNVCTDNSSPYSCSFDTTVPADGLYDLRATADTGSGTVTSAVIANRRLDNTAPSVAMTDPGTPLSGTVSLGATATDIGGSGVSSVTIQRSPAGAGTWTDICTDSSSPYSCSFDTTSVGDALYDFRAVGTDVAGNSANSTSSNRRIDNVAPTTSLTDPGSPLRGTVTLDATASDGGGILNVKIQRSPAGVGTWTDICTDATSPYSCSFDTTVPADGLYDLRAVATDNASRSTNSTVVTNRRLDNTAPTVSMTDPGTPLSGTVTLGATASDTGSGVANVKVQRSPAGAGTWTDVCTDSSSPYSCSFDTTTVGDELYDFRAVATDDVALTNSSTVANRRIDNVVPTVSLTDPGANIRGTISLDATASDGGGILNVKIQRSPAGLNSWMDICTDNSSPYSCSTDTSTWGGDGLYDLRALATDNASRTATSMVTNRRVDNTLPTVTMTDPGAYLNGTNVTLQATASDAGSGVSSVTIQLSPAGAGTWTDICTDLSSPYSCTGVNTTTWGGDGLYDLRAVTIDVAGNPNTSATVANRRVDNTAPTAGLTDPGSPLRGATVTLNATGTDTGGSGVLNVKIQRAPTGGSTWTDICTDNSSPYSCTWNTTLVTDGGYDLRAVTTDNAGNSTNSSLVVNRVVDNTAPTATNIQTTNVGGGTAGQADTGDTIVFTFSEQIAPGTIVGGWNGTGTQTVTVTVTPTTVAIAGATLVNGTISLPGGGYALNGKSIVFSNSTISQAGATLTVTLGTPDNPQWLRAGAAGQMSWPVAAALTDIAGNAITTVTRLEVTPPNDAEF